MEKTEMMKKFEDETCKHSVILKFMAGGQALESKDFPKIGSYDYSTDYIAWLEAKANITDDTIEKFQEIITKQCDEISTLKEKAEAYDRLMSGGKKKPKEVANFLDLPIAQDKEGFWHAFGSTPVVSDGLRGEWNSFLGYKQQIPSCNIRYSGDWKDSLTLPDGWETKGETK